MAEKQQPQKPPAQKPLADTVVTAARHQVWAADVACFYAQKRFSETGTPSDRRLWQERQEDARRAVASLEAAEQALARTLNKG